MKVYEIGTGYTSIPARMGAATEIVVEQLTKAMLKKGVCVEILDIEAKDRLANDLPIREVKVPGVFTGTDVQLGLMHKLKRVVYSVSLAATLKKLLKKEKEPVVLHFHNQYNLFFFLKLVPSGIRRKAVIAYTNHSYIWHGAWEEIQDTIQKRYFQEVSCMKHADFVFVLNEQTRRNVVNQLQVPAQKVHLIDNGVNVDVYSILSAQEKEEAKTQLGLKGKKVFLHVGSVCERKNQLEAVRLLLPMMQQDADVVFCYAGGLIDREYQQSIIRFAEEHQVSGQVRYLGEVQPGDGLNRIYNCAEAMIFPSKAEGFSLVIIEAMSAGLPVVINESLRFSLEEDCLRYTDDARFGQLVKMKILDAAARERVSESSREAVVKKYSWDRIAQDYLDSWK